MAQSLIACPLCSTASFCNTSALCLSLVNVASKWLRCTLCDEELRGIDKLTIHLIGHLINNAESAKNSVLEPLNLGKPQAELLQGTHDQEMVLDKNANSKMFQSNDATKDMSERFSLKIDDEVMIFFNSNNKNRHCPEDKNNSETKHRAIENVVEALNETISTTGLPKVKLNFTKHISNMVDENKKNTIDQQSQMTAISPKDFIFPPDNNPVHPDISHINLSSVNGNKETSDFQNTFGVDKNLNNHYNSFRNLEKNKSSFLSPNGERVLGYRCDVCSLVFPDEHILSMHRQLIHVELNGDPSQTRSFKCHLCSKSFVMKGSLMVHMRVAHFGGAVVARLVEAKQLETNAVSPESAQFVCAVCNKGFRKEQQLIQHEKLHDGKQCDVCMKTFTTKYFLRKHKRLHTGEMPYTCHVCNKSFTFQQSYHKHLLYHSDDKPHICPDCGRAFKELSTLHNHQRIHTGEKPFSCETCGKCFRQRVSYLVHRRIHTGVMPYQCQDCGKTFRYKVSERTHKCLTSTNRVSSEAPDSLATVTSHDVVPCELPNKNIDFQPVSEVSGNAGNEWHSKESQTFPSQMCERNGSYPEPADFFSLVMSPSDRLQNLTLSTHGQTDCNKQESIDTESLKQLLYDVADYN